MLSLTSQGGFYEGVRVVPPSFVGWTPRALWFFPLDYRVMSYACAAEASASEAGASASASQRTLNYHTVLCIKTIDKWRTMRRPLSTQPPSSFKLTI
jgi:hypothetical protein